MDILTSSLRDAGTDDHIYVGVVRSWGGREFPLNVDGFNDFEASSNVKHALGRIWNESLLAGARNPKVSIDNGFSDPRSAKIEVSTVSHVYIRKAGSRRPAGDDKWELTSVMVSLFGTESEVRTYEIAHRLWFGNEFWQRKWIPSTGGTTILDPTIPAPGRVAQ